MNSPRSRAGSLSNSRSALISLVIAGFCLLAVQTAFGGPPFVTDDPEPVDFHHWEFYVASMQSEVHGDWSGTAPHFEVNYGAAPDLQLHMIAPLAYDSPPTGTARYGFGDLELGAKYRFIQETNGWPQVGVFPLIELPTGSEHENLGNGHMQAFVPVWIQKSLSDTWTVYGGAGYGVNSLTGHENWGFGGAVLQDQVLTNVLIGVEVYHQTTFEPDFPNEGTAFNVGTVIDFTDQHHLLFSAGRSISGQVAFQCYIAYQFTFDNSLWHFWSGGTQPPHGGGH